MTNSGKNWKSLEQDSDKATGWGEWEKEEHSSPEEASLCDLSQNEVLYIHHKGLNVFQSRAIEIIKMYRVTESIMLYTRT